MGGNIPLKDASAATVAWQLFETIICRYGAPDQLLSDRGQNFLSRVVTEVCKIFQITRLHTSSYHPQTNATCERTNSTIAQSIRALCDKNPLNWPTLLPGIAAALRTVPSTESTQFSPFFILFKQECRLPIDTALHTNVPTPAQPCMEDIIANAELTKTIAQENILNAQKKYKDRYDKKASTPVFLVGQRVLVQCSHNIPGLSKKLQQKYDGPYYITKILPNNVYVLRHCDNNKLLRSPVNAMRLRPYFSPDDRPTNIPDNVDDTQSGQTDSFLDTAPDSQPRTPHCPTPVPNSQEPPSTPGDSTEDDVYLVDKILACKRINNTKHYKVKWTGYRQTTWEPEVNIPAHLIREFHIHKTNAGRRRLRQI